VYAIALIYHTVVHVQWHSHSRIIIDNLTPRHPVYAYIVSFYSVYVSSSSLFFFSSLLFFFLYLFFAPSRALFYVAPLFIQQCPLACVLTAERYRSILTLDRRHPFWLLRRKPRRHIIYRLCVTASVKQGRKVSGSEVALLYVNKFYDMFQQ